MDVLKQIEYWAEGSDEDIEVAKELFAKNRYRHALFFGHLALEKILKAHVTKKTSAVPGYSFTPRIIPDLREAHFETLSVFDMHKLEDLYKKICGLSSS